MEPFCLDVEQEEDKMAGGFFREDGSVKEVQLQAFDLKGLPKVPNNVVESSVSLALDAESSSTNAGSDVEESNDVEAKVLFSVSANDENNQTQISTEHILKQNIAQQTTVLPDVITRQQVIGTENINSNDTAPMQSKSNPVELNELRMDIDNDNVHSVDNSRKLCDKACDNKSIDIKDSVVEDTAGNLSSETLVLSEHTKDILNSNTTPTFTDVSSIQKLSETGKISQSESSPESNVSPFDTELDDLEDEINQKKRLIEKLLSDRRTILASPSDAKENVGNLRQEKSRGDEGQSNNSMQIFTPSETSLQYENNLSDDGDSRNVGSNRPTAIMTGDDIGNSAAHDVCDTETSQQTETVQSVPNEFEGITYVSTTVLMYVYCEINFNSWAIATVAICSFEIVRLATYMSTYLIKKT